MNLTHFKNWKTMSALGVGFILIGSLIYARIDAWIASRTRPQLIRYAEKPGVAELVVVAHGYKGGFETMTNVVSDFGCAGAIADAAQNEPHRMALQTR